MKQVQNALADIVQVHRDVYRPTRADQEAPAQYATYTTMTLEEAYWDDEPRTLKTFVYLSLWSRIDPTETAGKIRAAMRKAGFAMKEESTGNASGKPDYATNTKYFAVSWTWVVREEIEDGNQDEGL